MAWVLGVQGAPSADTPPPFLANDFKFPLWYEDFSVRSGFGYKDNVALSSTEPRGSAYWHAGGDVMVYRLPSGGWTLNSFASVNHLGYLDTSTGVNNEESAMLMVQVVKELGRNWRMGLGGNYLYQDQVLDVSAAEGSDFTIGEVRGHTAIGRWFVRKDLHPYWVEVEDCAARQWLAAPLDGFWQSGPRLTLGRSHGHGSDLTLTYQWSYLTFDSRLQTDATGLEVADTSLRFASQCADLAWHQVWDQQAHWHTVTRVGVDLNRDNAAGYFDFTQYRLAEQLKYRAKTWELSLALRLGYYDYPVQTAAQDDPSLRRKTGVGIGVHAEKTLSKHFRLFADYSYDRSISNAAYDRYLANGISSGVEFRF